MVGFVLIAKRRCGGKADRDRGRFQRRRLLKSRGPPGCSWASAAGGTHPRHDAAPVAHHGVPCAAVPQSSACFRWSKCVMYNLQTALACTSAAPCTRSPCPPAHSSRRTAGCTASSAPAPPPQSVRWSSAGSSSAQQSRGAASQVTICQPWRVGGGPLLQQRFLPQRGPAFATLSVLAHEWLYMHRNAACCGQPVGPKP